MNGVEQISFAANQATQRTHVVEAQELPLWAVCEHEEAPDG